MDTKRYRGNTVRLMHVDGDIEIFENVMRVTNDQTFVHISYGPKVKSQIKGYNDREMIETDIPVTLIRRVDYMTGEEINYDE